MTHTAEIVIMDNFDIHVDVLSSQCLHIQDKLHANDLKYYRSDGKQNQK